MNRAAFHDHPKCMGSHGVFLTAEWRHLAMLNYEVDAGLLLPFVPVGTELDRWNGRVFVSLVGFRFLKTKLFGFLPIPMRWNIAGRMRRGESGRYSSRHLRAMRKNSAVKDWRLRSRVGRSRPFSRRDPRSP